MVTLIINPHRMAILSGNEDYAFLITDTDYGFGTLIHDIEQELGVKTDDITLDVVSDNIKQSIINEFNKLQKLSYKSTYICCGFTEYGGSLLLIRNLFGRSISYYPQHGKIDELRIKSGFSLNIAEIERSVGDISEPFYMYSEIKSTEHLILSILDFYARKQYCLQKCSFCGQWYVNSNKGKQARFCSRPFVFKDWEGKIHRYPDHYTAKKRILDRCDQRYRTIRKRLYGRVHNGNEMIDFESHIDELKGRIKQNPSIENLREYERYLYTDANQFYRRYGR